MENQPSLPKEDNQQERIEPKVVHISKSKKIILLIVYLLIVSVLIGGYYKLSSKEVIVDTAKDSSDKTESPFKDLFGKIVVDDPKVDPVDPINPVNPVDPVDPLDPVEPQDPPDTVIIFEEGEVLYKYDHSRTNNITSEFQKPIGELKWKSKIGQWGASNTPVVYKGQVLFTGFDSYLYALNFETGKEIWKIKLDKFSNFPAEIQEDTLFIGDQDGKVYAIDLNKQDILWEYQSIYQKENSSISGPSSIKTPVVFYKDKLFFSNNSGVMHCLDANNGKLLWKFETPLSFAFSTPAIKDNIMYFGSNDGYIHSLYVKDGKVNWSNLILNSISVAPLIYKDKLIILDNDGIVHIVNQVTGKSLWEYKYNEENTVIGVFPNAGAIKKSLLYLSGTNDNLLDVIDLEKLKVVDEFEATEWVESSPLITNDTIYFGTHARNGDHVGYLYAVDLQNMSELWKFRTIDLGFITSPYFYKGMLFIKDGLGTIYAIE